MAPNMDLKLVANMIEIQAVRRNWQLLVQIELPEHEGEICHKQICVFLKMFNQLSSKKDTPCMHIWSIQF